MLSKLKIETLARDEANRESTHLYSVYGLKNSISSFILEILKRSFLCFTKSREEKIALVKTFWQSSTLTHTLRQTNGRQLKTIIQVT